MEVSAYKANGMFAKELEDELMKFTMKLEDYGCPTKEVHSDMVVDITECTKSMGNKSIVPQYQDLTESEGSSSFGESDSDFDSLGGDTELLSEFCGASALEFDGFGDSFRRKKLTAHWRSFIQPIMWRCKWTELQIKKLQSLAQKYDRELEAHNKRKQIQLEESTLVDGVKSLAFSRKNVVNDLIRRKRRRRTDATTDTTEYMSHHNLFSYYENRKSSVEGALMSNLPKNSATQKVNIDDEFWANDDMSSFISGDGDNSLEDALRKIELLQSQAGKLRSRIERVISGNSEKIFLADKLSLPPHFDDSAHANDGDAVGTYIANHGDCLPNADTVHDHFPNAYGNVEDGALIDNRRVKEEMNNFDEVIIDPVQKPLDHIDMPVITIKPKPAPADEHSPSKTRSVAKTTAPRSKRKRGRKKSARHRTRRTPG